MKKLHELAASWEQRSKDLKNSHVITCNNKKNITCNNHMSSHVQISKDDYKELVIQLEQWDVRYRGYVLKNYPIRIVREAIQRTKYKNPSNAGAYFTTVIKSLYKNIPDKNKTA